MKLSKILVAIVMGIVILLAQFGTAFAAPANQTTQLSGKVHSLTLETDVNTAVTTVLVTIVDKNNTSQTVRLSIDTAKTLGLITTDESGTPVINPSALGTTIQISPTTVITDDEAHRHPVGDALATFFAGITDYDTIMEAHEQGFGFGVIVQALRLTQKLEGNSETFLAILQAKQTGDFSAFVLEDGTSPTSWKQFRKAVLAGEKKITLGTIMSNKDNKNDKGNGHGNGNENGNKDKDKDKGNGNK